MKIDFLIKFLPLIICIPWAIFILLMGRFLPPRLPIFYSLPWGENQLATSLQFLILPSTAVCISLINLLIYWHLHPSQALFKKILLGVSLSFTLILLLSFIKIILIFI